MSLQPVSKFPTLRVTDIGEFIRFHGCERRFKLSLNNKALAKKVPFAERLFNQLDPVLDELGRQSEAEWEEELKRAGFQSYSPTLTDEQRRHGSPWDAFADFLGGLTKNQNVFGREIRIEGSIGEFDLSGKIDFIVVSWKSDIPTLRIVECKASRKDKTYHHIQLAAYLHLIQNRLKAEPLSIEGHPITDESLEAVVARIDEVTNTVQDILSLPQVDVSIEIADLERLLAANGLLSEVCRQSLDDLDFQLNAKCDGCVFTVHCLPESARQRRLELTGFPPSVCRSLRDAGIKTIDDLADIDAQSEAARQICSSESVDLDLGKLKAIAATRRTTLQNSSDLKNDFRVQALPHGGTSQLPAHTIDGVPLVRVYLEVNYDYSENRIGALAAHVTVSEYEIHTPFDRRTDQAQPIPTCIERESKSEENQNREPQTRPLSEKSKDVYSWQTSPWTGDSRDDTVAEKHIIQSFFSGLIDAIATVATAKCAPIHFYVYSRSEITQLMEACSRCGGQLLGHFRQLLGCRESLEQLIFSCVQDEITHRYALGWTGRGLSVATSLPWFGRTFHWRRTVGGEHVDLDRIFEQDIFDFRSTLGLDLDGNWWDGDPADAPARRRFEIRSRFHDTLTAPYWRAFWGQLSDAGITDARTRNSIDRYNRVGKSGGLIHSYFIARVHALRWIEERIRFKNNEIEKPLIDIPSLNVFDLAVNDTGRSARDFLVLDHHIKLTDWITMHLQAPLTRMQAGKSLIVKSVTAANGEICAKIDLSLAGLSLSELARRSDFSVDSFVRLTPCADDVERRQTVPQLLRGGITCRIKEIDWLTGNIALVPIPTYAATNYVLHSGIPTDGNVFNFATIDASISDFIAGRVENRLSSKRGTYVFDWFEPTSPKIPAIDPLSDESIKQWKTILSSWIVPNSRDSNAPLMDDQQDAILSGINSRVQLLKGPPGTGKTVTTATSTIVRSQIRGAVGEIILLASNTHPGVDTLLSRLALYIEPLLAHAQVHGAAVIPIHVVKVHSSSDGLPPDTDGIIHISAKNSWSRLKDLSRTGVVIAGGTTGAILKFGESLSSKAAYANAGGFQTGTLVVDEASMMVFPHFLSLATFVRRTGQILLSGDNRQLPPIVAHDWEHEDRPPAQLYQPFKSAYEAILRIIGANILPKTAIIETALTYTFRLPSAVRQLISCVYFNLDDIELSGRSSIAISPAPYSADDPWNSCWDPAYQIILITHAERTSRKSNPLEAQIIERVLERMPQDEQAIVAGIVTPHRAQRSLLEKKLEKFSTVVTAIDTVERFQGGERPVIIVSATESDPHAIGVAANFILNLNRANVAFSRTQERLIVICSETLINFIPPERTAYESASLWKALRSLCDHTIFQTEIDGHRIIARVPALDLSQISGA